MTEPTQQDLKAWRYDPIGRAVWQGGHFIAMVRGWGYLTGKGYGALGLSDSDARKVQDAIGQRIANIPAYEAEIQALKIQLGKCLIQEHETIAVAVAHGWRYRLENYTDEKALAAYEEWKERQ